MSIYCLKLRLVLIHSHVPKKVFVIEPIKTRETRNIRVCGFYSEYILHGNVFFLRHFLLIFNEGSRENYFPAGSVKFADIVDS